MFYSGKLTHMILHDDSKWPYSTLEDVWEQYHDRYEGHCIVINAHWHDPALDIAEIIKYKARY